MEQAPRISRVVEKAPLIVRAMDKAPCIGRWLSIAEKLLASRQIEECFEVCNELEKLIAEKNGIGELPGEWKNELEKLRSLQCRLNSLMVKEVRNKR